MHKTPEITRLIHENLWIVISFAFSRPAIDRILETRFTGEWKPLRSTIYTSAEIRADRALLEMATQLRLLDDEQELNDYFVQTKAPPLGEIIQGDGAKTDLHFRDMTNKILHAARFDWDLSAADDPSVICRSSDPTRWKEARISIIRLMALVGQLMH